MAESIQKEDWERFRALGCVPPSIREVVLRSWVRSRDSAGLHSLQRAPSVAHDELHGLRSRNSRLRRAAQSAVRRTGYMLDDAGAMLLLCDQGGVILEAAGDARVMSRGEENHLHPGGRWEETGIGTNAIGTALHLAKPVFIAGVEHFCEAIQRWSCAAAPIRDPFSHQILGAVDISAPSDENLRQGAALSVSLALQIEEALRSIALRDHQLLFDHLLSRGRMHGDEVLLLNRHGQRIWSSSNFGPMEERFAVASEACQGFDVGSDGDTRSLAHRMRQILPEAAVDLISEGDDVLGLIVTFGTAPQRHASAGTDLDGIARTGPDLAEICAGAARIVESGVPLLIKGEVGSGKETLARALHEIGPQADNPIEVLDCSLLSSDALRLGAAETALARLSDQGGTLLLDEPAETPLPVQPLLAQRLARLMRESRGAVQLISLSSVPLSERFAEGALRGDLHFRLSGAVVRLPRLADRRADLPNLVRLFAEVYSDRRKGSLLRFTPAAMLRLQAYEWPGNLRELRNLIESLSATSFSRLVDASDLPAAIAQGMAQTGQERLRDRERADILDMLAETGGNMTETARRLGISRSTLYLKLDQYGLPRARRSG